MIRSGNPILRSNAFKNSEISGVSSTMTLQGAVNKTFILLGLCIVSAAWVWQSPAQRTSLIMPAVIIGFITAIVTVFKKEWAPVTSIVYALVEGVVLGGISALMEKTYQGIVQQAVMLTFGVFFCILFAYKTRIIKATENFKLGVFAATGGIALLYLVSMIMGFFGSGISFIHNSTPIGIGFSVFVVIIAALNLVLDFDFIEKTSKAGAPKYMEWYSAFALIVTLVWLYIEILRLLAKTRER
jgi:uncharacterized YccA/Bax inhibitor family protein